MAAGRIGSRPRSCYEVLLNGQPHDVGGDCAVYMVRPSSWNPLCSGQFRHANRANNLDGPAVSPYTSAVPGNGRDFGPPRRPRDALGYGGDVKRILQDVPALRT